jgi:hypothetical protein
VRKNSYVSKEENSTGHLLQKGYESNMINEVLKEV